MSIVTRLNCDASFRDVRTWRTWRVDMTIDNLRWVLDRLDVRERFWTDEAAARDRNPAAARFMLGMIELDLPCGWEPAEEAFRSLSVREATAWLLPREVRPLLDRAARCAAVAIDLFARRRGGARPGDGDIAEAIDRLEELVLLKRRLGFAHHCARELLMLAALKFADNPQTARVHAAQAMACNLPDGPAGFVPARLIPLRPAVLNPRHLSYDADDLVITTCDPTYDAFLSAMRKVAETGMQAEKALRLAQVRTDHPAVLVDDGHDMDTLFHLRLEGGRALPFGPFEPFGEGSTRRGIRQMMSPTPDTGGKEVFVTWTYVKGRWLADMRPDKSTQHRREALKQLQAAALDPENSSLARRVIGEAVVTLEAFVNQASQFIADEGRAAWPATMPRQLFDDPAAYQRRGKFVRKTLELGDSLFGPGWMPEDDRSRLEWLLNTRNEAMHPKVAPPVRFRGMPMREGSRPFDLPGHRRASNGRMIPANGEATYEDAAEAIRIADTTMRLFRLGYAVTYRD